MSCSRRVAFGSALESAALVGVGAEETVGVGVVTLGVDVVAEFSFSSANPVINDTVLSSTAGGVGVRGFGIIKS